MAEPAITLLNVNKYYDNFHVLRDVCLDVSRGEKVVICGPSGSGKSTLIRCINRLESHDSGKVVVEGVELSDNLDAIDEVRREVGMVFQQFNLFPHLTVLEGCVLPLIRVRKLSRREAGQLAMKQLDRLQIASQAHKYPDQLSGGQKQRAAIARALSMQPRIMLFDEPTSALDPEMVGEVLDCMMTLANEGMTIVCVTHEVGFARNVADRAAFMAEGRIVELGPPVDLFDNPRHEKTRLFLEQVLSR